MQPELDAAEANRRFYRSVAELYDEKEQAVASPRARSLLRGLLERALSLLGDDPLVLDACGGSGNVSELLAGMDVATVLVDVSPQMIARWQAKAARLGLEPEVVEAEVADFLAGDPRRWDLIVFSSALHHLDDYAAAAGLAADRLAPGGVLVTVFDPVPAARGDRLLRRLDWILFQALHEPGDFLETIRARLRRSASGEPPVGRLAERYALEGVDDRALRRLLEERGLEIVLHERTADARLAPVRGLLRLLRRPSSFHLLARRPARPR